jgi:uncharacterized membrane protein
MQWRDIYSCKATATALALTLQSAAPSDASPNSAAPHRADAATRQFYGCTGNPYRRQWIWCTYYSKPRTIQST